MATREGQQYGQPCVCGVQTTHPAPRRLLQTKHPAGSSGDSKPGEELVASLLPSSFGQIQVQTTFGCMGDWVLTAEIVSRAGQLLFSVIR